MFFCIPTGTLQPARDASIILPNMNVCVKLYSSYGIYEFVVIEKFDRVTQLSITSAGGVSTTRMHNNDDNACGGYFWKLNFTKTES